MVAPARPPDTVAEPAGPRPPDFDALYEAHFAFVWRSLRQLGVPPASLDDAAQNVFLVVHRRLAEFEGRASVRTWLFRIAMRVASDVRREGRRRGSRTGPLASGDDDERALLASLASPERDPLEAAERVEALSLLERLLERLDDAQRAVFVLAELEQMTVPEIAEALEVNPNTVGSRLRAARRAFDRAVSALQRRSP